jgi:hypothetical protein
VLELGAIANVHRQPFLSSRHGIVVATLDRRRRGFMRLDGSSLSAEKTLNARPPVRARLDRSRLASTSGAIRGRPSRIPARAGAGGKKSRHRARSSLAHAHLGLDLLGSKNIGAPKHLSRAAQRSRKTSHRIHVARSIELALIANSTSNTGTVCRISCWTNAGTPSRSIHRQ